MLVKEVDGLVRIIELFLHGHHYFAGVVPRSGVLLLSISKLREFARYLYHQAFSHF